MRVVRFLGEDKTPQFGWVFEDKVGKIQGDIFFEYQREEADLSLADLKLLAPIRPGKIICVGRNYIAHAKEHEVEVPAYPMIFLKPPTSVIGPEDPIVLPPQSSRVEHEGELAVVIGKRARWLQPEEAMQVVFGYTIANDVTARDLQRLDGQWTRGKGFDTFCPLGPWIDTDFDPTGAMLSTHVNDELRQMAPLRDMVFSITQLLVFISSVMTLEPGDLIMTGTPGGVGPLLNGDRVAVRIDKLGELANPVKLEEKR